MAPTGASAAPTSCRISRSALGCLCRSCHRCCRPCSRPGNRRPGLARHLQGRKKSPTWDGEISQQGEIPKLGAAAGCLWRKHHGKTLPESCCCRCRPKNSTRRVKSPFLRGLAEDFGPGEGFPPVLAAAFLGAPGGAGSVCPVQGGSSGGVPRCEQGLEWGYGGCSMHRGRVLHMAARGHT